jgi:PAS domain S-box-containing protein
VGMAVDQQHDQGTWDALARLTEAQWRLAEETVGVGVFELDLTSDRWVATPRVAALFGLSAAPAQDSWSEWEKQIFVDDRLKVRAAMTEVKRTGAFSVEFRTTHPDGSVHWLVAKGKTSLDASGTVRWLHGTCLDITERKVLEVRLLALRETLEAQIKERTREFEASYSELRESERRFRLLVEGVTDYAIFMLDPGGNIIKWNTGAERLKGYTAAEIIGSHFSRFYPPEDVQSGLPSRLLQQAVATGKAEHEGWRVRKDGSRFWANVVIHAIRDADQQLVGFAKVTRDLTERRAAEEELRQAQKMEAVGQLTGGIAHDFNNLLTVISGNLELIQRHLSARVDDELKRYVKSALHGASRAAVLTHQLLAFSRRQPLDPTTISPNTLISHISELLRRTLPETISIETILAGGVWSTFADINQLENCLLNLAVNARDAMPDGGKLTIEAANVYLDDSYSAAAEVPPGQYVGIFVSDTGGGMTSDVIERAFEPFFTTKEPGRGTGLGLSQVYGFIKQSGGHVKIYSEVGFGTTIKIYLPRLVTGKEADEPRPTVVAVPRGRGETILVVEDDPNVRSFALELVRELGYQALEAEDGPGALRQLARHGAVTLLFTDVGLPGGMNGRQLADEARRRKPRLKVLFTSGYARNAIIHHGRLDPGVQLITKPFTYSGLAVKIRQVLDSD